MSASSKRAAFLRGVNLAGRRSVAMSALRACIEGFGCRDVRTLLQSGNVVLCGPGSDGALERRLEREAEEVLGLVTEFHVRSRSELQQVVDGNPFPDAARADPSRLLVVFFRRPIAPAAMPALATAIAGRERAAAGARHIYLFYPDGIGRSSLTTAKVDKAIGQRGTARNWNTVNKVLAALA